MSEPPPVKKVTMYFTITGLFVCLFFGATAPGGPGLFIREVSRSHTTTHHSL